jgi:hypothetical protein
MPGSPPAAPPSPVSVTPVGEQLDEETLARHLRAMADHPEVTLSLVTPSGWEPGTGPEQCRWLPREEGLPTEGVVDGRWLAESLLFTGGDPRPAPMIIAARTATLEGGTLPLRWPTSEASGPALAEWYRWIVGLLVQGPAWLDPIAITGSAGPVADRALWEEWPSVVAVATSLGLLDRPGDQAKVVVAWTRRAAAFPTADPETETSEPGTGLVATVLGQWHDLRYRERLAQTTDLTPPDRGPTPDWLPRRRDARPHPLCTFVVVAPGYTTRHGGIVALHRLCDRLNAIGYDAFLHPIGFSHEVRPDWLTPLLRGRSAKDMVAIYPETVSGNELGADRVVRWLLNRPGRIHGNAMDEGPDDLLVSFSEQVSDQYPVLSVPLIDPQAFFPKDRPGTGKLLWIGKGSLSPGFDRSGTRLITNGWPRDRRHFGQVLRAADVLYTCDWLSSVIDEALMCGTPVVLVGEQEWSRDEIVMRPGMVYEDGDLEAGREQVGEYFARCVEAIPYVDASIEEFVQLVNEHFPPVKRPAVALPDPGRD